MPNLRVISDNAIDRAVLSATTTAPNFAVTNLQLGRKSDVWRAGAGLVQSLRATWASPESLRGVALPFCDLSPTATIRVRVTGEVQATNLLTYSEQFDNAAWTKAGTVTANTVVAPDGNQTADTLNGSSDATLTQSFTTVAGKSYTFSIWLRADSAYTCNLYFYQPNSTSSLATAAVTTAWQRFTVTVVAPGTSLSAQIGGGGTVNSKNLYVWGAQAEVGTAASSYYQTTTAAATRPLGYIDTWQSYAYDSGAVLACPAPVTKPRGFTAAQAATAYAFQGGTIARHWLSTTQSAYGLCVDIFDTANVPGFIEAAFLVAGQYWEPDTNMDYGATAQLVDASKTSRNDAGDLISDIGTISKELNIPMSKLSLVDQAALWDILRDCGARYPVFISMFPNDTNLHREARHQVYGKLVETPAMALPFFNLGSATLKIASI